MVSVNSLMYVAQHGHEKYDLDSSSKMSPVDAGNQQSITQEENFQIVPFS